MTTELRLKLISTKVLHSKMIYKGVRIEIYKLPEWHYRVSFWCWEASSQEENLTSMALFDEPFMTHSQCIDSALNYADGVVNRLRLKQIANDRSNY